MLARRILPDKYKKWNEQWGAPFGYQDRIGQRFWSRFLTEDIRLRMRGPFSFQPNSETRSYEYPWAYYAVPLHSSMRIIEIGGGLSGFQIVLSMHGVDVTNIDPGYAAKGKGWKCDAESINRLNKLFGTSVRLYNTNIMRAPLEKESYDCAYAISVLEHIPQEEIHDTLNSIWLCLKPGGKFVVSVDLFLNLKPFSSRISNEYGGNIPLNKIISHNTFQLICGDKKELFGTEEFQKDIIMANLEEYLIGGYPSLAQCVVLKKK